MSSFLCQLGASLLSEQQTPACAPPLIPLSVVDTGKEGGKELLTAYNELI